MGAGAQAALELLIQLKDEASTAMDGIGAKATEMSNSVKEASGEGGIKGLAGNLLGMVNPATLAVGAVAGIGTAALDIAGQFNQSQNDIQASLGLTKDDAAALTDVARQVFGENWGSSVQDASDSLITVRQQMKGLTNEDLKGATEAALALRDTFGMDVTDSANAANTLMKEFGLTSKQAFDFITKGQQEGLNSSGDFLDSITEYSTQFKAGGADAEQMFSLMKSGLAGGVLGTDKAADMFKEFRLRIMEGGDAAQSALFTIGSSVDDVIKKEADMNGGTISLTRSHEIMRQQFAAMGIDVSKFSKEIDGSTTAGQAFSAIMGKVGTQDGPTVANAFGIVQKGLQGLGSDALKQAQGVALMGSQFEDMGLQAAMGVNMTNTSMASMAGATDSLNAKYNNLGALAGGAWRQIQLALEPVGAGMLQIGNAVLPIVVQGVQWLSQGISTVVGWIVQFVTFISGLIPPLDQVGASTTNVGNIFQQVWGAIQAFIMPVLSSIFGELSRFWTEIEPKVTAVWNNIQAGIQTVIGFVQPFIQNAIAAISSNWSAIWGGIQTVFSGVWQVIQGIVQVAWSIVSGIISTGLSLLQGDWSGAWTAIQNMLSGIWTGIQNIVQGAWTTLSGFISTALAGLKTTWDTIWNTIGGTLSTAWTNFVTTVQTKMGEIGTFLSSVPGTLLTTVQNIGSSIINGIIEGLKNAGDAVKNFLLGIAQGALDAVKSFFGIKSPSDEMATVGQNLLLGMQQGMGNQEKEMLKVWGQLFVDMKNMMAVETDPNNEKGMVVIWNTMLDQMFQHVNIWQSGVLDFIKQLFLTLDTLFSTKPAAWADDWNTAMDRLIADAQAAIDKITELKGLLGNPPTLPAGDRPTRPGLDLPTLPGSGGLTFNTNYAITVYAGVGVDGRQIGRDIVTEMMQTMGDRDNLRHRGRSR